MPTSAPAREGSMENATMGKVLVPAMIENLDDLFEVRKGDCRVGGPSGRGLGCLDRHRRLRAPDADAIGRTTGPGPGPDRGCRGRSAANPDHDLRAVRLTIQGRDCITDVAGIADHLPVIIGQIPLESMDWVVDMKGQKLIGNPEHGGEDMVDIF